MANRSPTVVVSDKSSPGSSPKRNLRTVHFARRRARSREDELPDTGLAMADLRAASCAACRLTSITIDAIREDPRFSVANSRASTNSGEFGAGVAAVGENLPREWLTWDTSEIIAHDFTFVGMELR